MDFDVRHNLVARIDYRFKGGKFYTGPIWGEKRIFENSGINLIVTTKSGEPYSAYINPAASVSSGSAQRQSLDGNPNGSRLPWQFRVDGTINKTFYMDKKNMKNEYRRRQNQVDVFLWVQNVLNTQNIINVYGYTGLPNDDGWLSSPQGQQQIGNELNAQSYVDLYNAKVDYPYYYGIPRLMRLGCRFYF
jgi:hypothetical protein